MEIVKDNINFKNTPSIELLEYISWKDEFLVEAEQAFTEFCYRYEKDIIEKSEIYSSKFNYSEVVALEVANCTFARVWKYPTFKLKKAKSKDIDKAILMWMYPILYTQLIKYGKENTCNEIVEDENLSIINDVDELINFTTEDVEKRRDLKIRLEIIEKALSHLSNKHKIIFLTYKAYEKSGKNIPRTITKQLREQLNLTQNSVRVYKNEATNTFLSYLKQLNGN